MKKRVLSIILCICLLVTALPATLAEEAARAAAPSGEASQEPSIEKQLPAEPEEPEQAEVPAEPEEPEQAEAPAEPEEPEQAEVPAEPEEVEREEAPAEPEQPEAPEEAEPPEEPHALVADEVAFAADVIKEGTCGTDVTWAFDTEGTLTISGSGAMDDYSYLSSPAAPWKSYRASILRVEVNEGVTYIGSYAFYLCKSLHTVVLPASVTEIAHDAFENCSSLAEITLPENLTKLGTSAFIYCSSLEHVEIPKGVQAILAATFEGCSSLESITIPGTVSTIGDGAFENCTGLRELVLSEGIETIGFDVFNGCSALTEVVIPESVTSMKRCFLDCTSLETVTVNSFLCQGRTRGTSEISTFWNTFWLDHIRNIIIPEGPTEIGDEAFSAAPSYNDGGVLWETIEHVTIPKSVRSIGYSALGHLINLKQVDFSEGLEELGVAVFEGCWGLDNVMLPNSLRRIKGSCFAFCEGMTNVKIPEGLEELGEDSFASCYKLEEIVLPEGLKSIEYYTFKDCTSLRAVTIPASVENIHMHAFSGSDPTLYVKKGSYAMQYAIDNEYSYFIVDDTSIHIRIAEGARAGEMTGVKLVASAGERQVEQPVDGRDIYFADLGEPESFSLELVNAYGDVFFRGDYTGDQRDVTIDGVAGWSDFGLTVRAGGQTVTDRVSVVWTRDGEAYATGAELHCVPEGTQLRGEIALDAGLSEQYRAPAAVLWTAGEGQSRIVDLEAMSSGTLTGRIVSGGKPVAGASVVVAQEVGGRTSYNVAVSDGDGNFSVFAYGAPAQVTVSAYGYEARVIELPAGGNLGEIELTPAAGLQISLNVTYRAAVRPGEVSEAQKLYALDDIEFAARDLTAQADLSGAVRTGTLLTLPGELAGHRLRITARDGDGSCAEASAELDVAEGESLRADLELVELGGVSAHLVQEAEDIRALIYGEGGALLYTGIFDDSGELQADALPDGDCAVVAMSDNDLVGEPASLSALDALGLSAGKDYVRADVRVATGAIAECEFDSVPALDASRFYYTHPGETSLSANKGTVTLGDYFSLRAIAPLQAGYAERARNVRWVFDLSDGSEYYNGTLQVDGLGEVPFSYSNNELTVPVEDPGRQVRLCAHATKEGSLRLSARLRFELDGREVVQPVGTVRVNVDGVEVRVPSVALETAITATGTAPGQSTVMLYDNDVLVGQTVAKKSGSWSIDFELYKPYALTEHRIYARIETLLGSVLRTKTSIVVYRYVPDAPHLSRVVMHSMGHSNMAQTVVFDFLHPENSTKGGYLYYTNNSDFAFVVEFEGDVTQVDRNSVKLDILLASNKTVTVDTVYEASQGCFLASYSAPFYNDSPKNVSVSYAIDSHYYYAEEELNERIAEMEKRLEEAGADGEDFDLNSLVPTQGEGQPMEEYVIDDAMLEGLSEEQIRELRSVIDSFNQAVRDYNALLEEMGDFLPKAIAFRDELHDFSEGAQDYIGTFEGSGDSFRMSGGAVELEASTEQRSEPIDMDADEFEDWLEREEWSLYLSKGDGGQRREEGGQIVYTYENALLFRTRMDGSVAIAELWSPQRLVLRESAQEANAAPPMQTYVAGYVDFAAAGVSSGQCQTAKISVNSQKIQNSSWLAEHRDLLAAYARQAAGQDELWARASQAAKSAADNARSSQLWLENNLPRASYYAEEFAGKYAAMKNLGDWLPKAGKYVGRAIAGYEIYGDLQGTGNMWNMLQQLQNVNSPGVGTLRAAIILQIYCYQLDLILNLPFAKELGFVPGLIMATMNHFNEKRIQDGFDMMMRLGIPVIKPVDGLPPADDQIKVPSAGPDQSGIVDPSGYIYEAVASNRLEGATVGCYEKRTEYDIYGDPHDVVELWDAEDFDQTNPLVSDANGAYAWDVPAGTWQVKAELEGYETAYSDWLGVPPPQLDVNLGMVSYAEPEITSLVVEPNAVEFHFNKYMRTDGLERAVQVYANGSPVSGSTEWIDAEENPKNPSETFVRSVRFVPDAPIDVGANVSVRVSTDAQSYAGVSPRDALEVSTSATAALEGIYSEETLSLSCGGSADIAFWVLPGWAASGKKVTVRSSSDAWLEVAEPEITLNSSGFARVRVTGKLPGDAEVVFALEGTRLECSAAVHIALPCEHEHVSAVSERGSVSYSAASDGLSHRVSGDGLMRMRCEDCGQYVEGTFYGVSYPYTTSVKEFEAHISDGNGRCAYCGAELHAVKLEGSNLTIGLGESCLPGVTVLPLGSVEALSCVSSKPKIVAVNEDGTLTGLKKGSAKITVSCGNLRKKLTVKVKAAPKSIRLSETVLTLGVGEERTLKATLSKSSASAIQWISSDPDVVRVENGVLHPLKPGTASVTARTFNGCEPDLPCVVTVCPAPTKPVMSKQTLTLAKGMSVQLTNRFEPRNAAGAVRYESADNKAVRVSEAGKLVAKKVTSAPVAVTITSYNGKSDVCYVTVVSAPTKVKMSQTKATLGVGDSLRLSATLAPAETVTKWKWSSSNKKVATVSQTGVVTTLKAGSAKITAKTSNGKRASCTVKVLAAPESFSLNFAQKDLGLGEHFTLEPVMPKKTAAALTWTSSNSCVGVDASGTLTANRLGTAVITATAGNGVQASCEVTVKQAPRSVALEAHELTLKAGKSVDAPAYSLSPEDSAGGVRFISANTKYVQVLANGKIKAVKATSAPVELTVETYNGKTDVCLVTVVKK